MKWHRYYCRKFDTIRSPVNLPQLFLSSLKHLIKIPKFIHWGRNWTWRKQSSLFSSLASEVRDELSWAELSWAYIQPVVSSGQKKPKMKSVFIKQDTLSTAPWELVHKRNRWRQSAMCPTHNGNKKQCQQTPWCYCLLNKDDTKRL